MYRILGATGNTGSRIAEKLLAKDKSVGVVGRNKDKLKPLIEKGARPFLGSLEDPGFLREVFAGATAAYILVPPHYTVADVRAYQNKVGDAIVEALGRSPVSYIVNLSSQGAELTEKSGPVLGLHDMEEKLNTLKKVNIVHLRPTYFLENLLSNIPLIKHQGIAGSPLRGDLEFPAIATADIATVASDYLLKLKFTGVSVRDLLGAEDITMNKMTTILGKAIGKEGLSYVQFSYDDARKAMIGSGLSADMAAKMVELMQSMNDGVGVRKLVRTAENTTTTRPEDFARIFAAIYQKS